MNLAMLVLSQSCSWLRLGRFAQVGDHRVDVVLQLGHLAAGLHLDGARQVALGHGGGDFGDGAHLRGEIGGQQVDVAGQILPGAGGAGDVRLAAEPAFHADFARHVVTCSAKVASVSVMLLIVSASAATSPLACTVSFWRRLPLATAVTTFTMPRTWSVRFEAMKLTLSVRSFQVPATPDTWAWPPSLPSVPTSRATRVTSEAKRVELVHHRVDRVLQLRGFRPSRRR